MYITNASYNTIGGTTAGAGNLISGNDICGVAMDGSATGNLVQGNYIGTDVTGTVAMGNCESGVGITASNNTIGGTTAGAGNVIAFNSACEGFGGVYIATGTGNAILSNSIFSNIGLGIDLAADGVTPNDAGDGDIGANNLQNFPVLTSVTVGGTTTIKGTLNSKPNTRFRLEFFSSSACDPTGYGEGEQFLGSTDAVTNGSGNASFTATFATTVAGGQVITATATDPDNNTSEFSQCIEQTTTVADLSVTKADDPDPVTVGNNLTYTLAVTNNGPNAATGVTLSDTLPAGVTFASATSSQGTCSEASGTVTCSLGTIGSGDSATVTIIVTANAAGTLSNTATVTGDGADPDSSNDMATASTTVNAPPTANAGPDKIVNAGDTVTLDGSGSSDPDNDSLAYSWSFTSKPAGSAAALLHPNTASPIFVADVFGDYVLELTVDDGRGGTDSDQVEITTTRRGDVNSDGKIDAQDAILAAKYALGLFVPNAYQRKASDVVPPCGTIDIRDVVRIAEVALGIENENAFTCSVGLGQSTRGMLTPANAHGSRIIQLRISSKEIVPGEGVTISIFSELALQGIQIGPEGSLSFDPEVIQIKAIQGILPYQVLVSEINNESGKAKFMVIAINEPKGGNILEIEIEAVGEEGASSRVNLTFDMVVTAEGSEVNVKTAVGKITLGKAVLARVDHVLNIPNPVRSTDGTRFVVEGQGIKDIQVQIYGLSGREVFSSGWVENGFEWQPMSRQGETLANGVYLYVVTVRGFGEGELVRSRVKKLVVLR